MEKIFVISLGGSLVAPDKIDIAFLKRFHKFILNETKRGKRFVIVVGGGRVAREYQQAACSVLGNLIREDLDWLGIHATRLNAHLLRTIFRKKAELKVIKNPTAPFSFKKSILIAAGWKPGASTDYDAVLLAKRLGAKMVINLTDIDFVYNRDPRRYKNARPIKKISWKEFRKLFGAKWDPGLSAPFDPVAARAAHEYGMKAAIINGKNFVALKAAINGKKFQGTFVG